MVLRKIIKVAGTVKLGYDVYGFVKKPKNLEVLKMKKELMKKGLLIGVGLASFAKDKAERFAKDLVKKGHINEKEGRKLVKSIYSEADKSRKNITKFVEKEINKVVKKGCASCKPKKKTVKKAVKKKVKKKVVKKKTVKRKKK